MGCNSSKAADPSVPDDGRRAVAESQLNLNQMSGRILQDVGAGVTKVATGVQNVAGEVASGVKNVAGEVTDRVIRPAGQVTFKVASRAIAVPKTLGQEIQTQAHHLRNVFVPPIAADDLKGFTLPVFPKSDEEREFILKSLSENFIFANLEKREFNSILDAFERVEFDAESEILKQGDEKADYFYIIYKGSVTYYVDGNQVGSSGAGKSFGELSLLYSSPRAATVKAQENCTLFRVDQKSFRSVLQKNNMQTAEQKLELLKKIDCLKDMELFDLQKLSSAMTPVNFEPGDVLVKKGEAGDAFFLIQEGTVNVTDITVGNSKFEDTTLSEGDYFGERALITSEPRAANVVAATKGIAMSIDKETFEKVLGNLSRLILKSQDKRKLVSRKHGLCVDGVPGFGMRLLTHRGCVVLSL
jgi:cAMP-dependent protein kinase regulator